MYFWNVQIHFFHNFWKFAAIISLNIFFVFLPIFVPSLFSSSGISIMHMLPLLILFHRSLRYQSFLFFSISLFLRMCSVYFSVLKFVDSSASSKHLLHLSAVLFKFQLLYCTSNSEFQFFSFFNLFTSTLFDDSLLLHSPLIL